MQEWLYQQFLKTLLENISGVVFVLLILDSYTAGTDYENTTGELFFKPGYTRGDMECMDILLHYEDSVGDMNESFTFAICPVRDEDVQIEDYFTQVIIVSKLFTMV